MMATDTQVLTFTDTVLAKRVAPGAVDREADQTGIGFGIRVKTGHKPKWG